MSFWRRFLRRPATPPPPDAAAVRAEERRMEIRVAQFQAERKQLEQEGERLFRRGAAARDEDERRTAARALLDCAARLQRCLREARRAAKEARALARIRAALEDVRSPGSPFLERFDEIEALKLEEQLLDDRVSEQLYDEKLNALLGAPPTGGAGARPLPALPFEGEGAPGPAPGPAAGAATAHPLPDPLAPDAEERLLAWWRRMDAERHPQSS